MKNYVVSALTRPRGGFKGTWCSKVVGDLLKFVDRLTPIARQRLRLTDSLVDGVKLLGPGIEAVWRDSQTSAAFTSVIRENAG
jgi:hypothetical protein